MLEDFIWIGKDLFESHLVDSHGGNMSIRDGDSIFITKRDVMLGHLKEDDIIKVSLMVEEGDKRASRDVNIHRAIYKNTNASAIIHAHPPYAIALSITEGKIIPQDSEGQFLIKSVPVVKVREPIGSEEVAKLLPPIFASNYVIAVVARHGSIAASSSLEEAYKYTSCLENSCKIITILKRIEVRPEKVERRPAIPPSIGVMGRTYRRHEGKR